MLEFTGVSKKFGLVRALDDVSFSVGPGEVVSLVGENGAGKSTLVRCLAQSLNADAGQMLVGGKPLGKNPKDVIAQGVSIVWQDLALCENLDVTSNLFLGRELRKGSALLEPKMRAVAGTIFRNLGVEIPPLDFPIHRLSGGQRQLVAIARATLELPEVLVLDEPTSALGVLESRTVLEVIRNLQRRGVSILLVSHRLDEVFEVSDRIVVLRQGRSVADLYRVETHPDDVISLMTGTEADSTAGQQLRRLHSLSEQLASADAGSVLPLTVASLSESLHSNQVAIFMPEASGGRQILRCTATLNLPENFEYRATRLAIEPGQGFVGRAVAEEEIVVVPNLAKEIDDTLAEISVGLGSIGAWAAPIIGQEGTLAVIVGFTDGIARLQTEQIQLLELFSTMAGAAIERGELVESLSVNVRSLRSLQGVLEVFAGPDLPGEGLEAALDAVCSGIACDLAVLYESDGSMMTRWATSNVSALSGAVPHDLLMNNAKSALEEHRGSPRPGTTGLPVTQPSDRTGLVTLESVFGWSRGDAVLLVWWSDRSTPTPGAKATLDGAANSFRLALERGLVIASEREADSLRQGQELQRNLTRRLGHELRTPLTAIKGFSSTLLRDDIDWTESDRKRFLATIEAESGRLSRLVDNLFDTSAMESGTFALHQDYNNVSAAIDRAVQVVGPQNIELDFPPSLAVWGDSDRLEQVFINLIGNSVKHGGVDTNIRVTGRQPSSSVVTAQIVDDGPGMPSDVIKYLNGVIEELDSVSGFGIRIVRGFIRAHGGTIEAESTTEGSTVKISLPTEPESQ